MPDFIKHAERRNEAVSGVFKLIVNRVAKDYLSQCEISSFATQDTVCRNAGDNLLTISGLKTEI